MKNTEINSLNNSRLKILLGFIAVLFLSYQSYSNTGSVLTIKYHSTTQNDSCFMNIYLPPGYNDVSDTSHYPVFYLMHGGGENYTYWINSGKADTVLNYYITNDICVPMILVMPDGKNIAPATYSNEIINDVIPYIESNYRVISDKDHRGIGGLSWGGMQAMELGIYHYEMFGYMSILSSGWFASETATFDKAKTFLTSHAAEMEKSIRYFYFAEGTSYDIAYANGMATLKLFRDYNLTVHYWEFQGGHQWSAWKEDFKAFAPYLFRDTTTKYISQEFMGGRIKNTTIMTTMDSLAPAPPDPIRTGYTFSGWFKQPDYIDTFDFTVDTIKANTTIYARWDINSYKVSFNSNGGNYTPDTVLVEYNGKVDEPAEPQKEGLYFAGWYTDETYSQKWVFNAFPVTSDLTLVAKWSDVTSLYENQQLEIVIFPNPAQSSIQILNLKSDAMVDIYNMEGKQMLHKTQFNSGDLLDIDKMPKGVYTMVVTSMNVSYHYKFIKQ